MITKTNARLNEVVARIHDKNGKRYELRDVILEILERKGIKYEEKEEDCCHLPKVKSSKIFEITLPTSQSWLVRKILGPRPEISLEDLSKEIPGSYMSKNQGYGQLNETFMLKGKCVHYMESPVSKSNGDSDNNHINGNNERKINYLELRVVGYYKK